MLGLADEFPFNTVVFDADVFHLLVRVLSREPVAVMGIERDGDVMAGVAAHHDHDPNLGEDGSRIGSGHELACNGNVGSPGRAHVVLFMQGASDYGSRYKYMSGKLLRSLDAVDNC